MARDEHYSRRNAPVSPGNWMWSIVLSYIPVVNILFFIITAIGSKRTSKRKWAVANLLWILIIAALCVAAYYIFKEQLTATLATYGISLF